MKSLIRIEMHLRTIDDTEKTLPVAVDYSFHFVPQTMIFLKIHSSLYLFLFEVSVPQYFKFLAKKLNCRSQFYEQSFLIGAKRNIMLIQLERNQHCDILVIRNRLFLLER